MNYFLRTVVITVLLVPFWRWLYPLLFEAVLSLPTQDKHLYGLYPIGFLASPACRALFFVFLTFWKLHYLSAGWSAEVETLRLQGTNIIASFLRWTVLAILLIFVPPAMSLLMLHLLTQYTTVPQWLSAMTSWIVLYVFLKLVWAFPYRHRSQLL